MKNTINLKDNRQQTSLHPRSKCKVSSLNRRKIQPKDKTKACKTEQEMDIETKPCNVDDKLKLPAGVAKLLCQTCHKLPNGIVFPLGLNFPPNESKRGVGCACAFHREKVEARALHGVRISYNQVYEWTQFVLEFVERHRDKLQIQDNHSSLPQNLPSNV